MDETTATTTTPTGTATYPMYRLNIVDKETSDMTPVNAQTCARAVACDDSINLQEHLTRLYTHTTDQNKHITAEERTKWNKAVDDLDGKADLDGNGILVLSQLPKSTKVNTTLTVAGWSGKTYTITNDAITATCPVELLPRENNGVTTAQMEALVGAMIAGGTQAAGSIQLVAHGDVPTVAIPVTLIIRRDL